MLAPCFDSLLSLAEAALGRSFVTAEAASLSGDEHLLLDLLGGARCAEACPGCDEGVEKAFACALCSTRILFSLACVEARLRESHR